MSLQRLVPPRPRASRVPAARAALGAVALLVTVAAHAELKRYFSGDPADVRPRLHGPLLILSGGGGDIAPAMQIAIDRLRGCTSCDAKIDVVVLRASGAEGFNEWFMKMNGVDSIASLVITDRDSANRDDVAAEVRNAELVYFAGGDQCNYIRWIKGTKVNDAVKAVHRRGGAIGGTSAGLAIQSEIAYDACPNQSAKSAEVLKDPFHVDVSLSRAFFDWKPMRDTITDTHFEQRERLGRLLVFMARALAEGERRVLGIGVSEGTAVLVDRRGRAEVHGAGPVHLIRGHKRAEVLERGKPLTYRGFRMWRLESGATFDLRRWPGGGGQIVDVVEGVVVR